MHQAREEEGAKADALDLPLLAAAALVAALAAHAPVLALAADQLVLARAAEEPVPAAAADEIVPARAAADPVLPPRPLITSLPPSPAITSGPLVPLILSGPSSPTSSPGGRRRSGSTASSGPASPAGGVMLVMSSDRAVRVHQNRSVVGPVSESYAILCRRANKAGSALIEGGGVGQIPSARNRWRSSPRRRGIRRLEAAKTIWRPRGRTAHRLSSHRRGRWSAASARSRPHSSPRPCSRLPSRRS